MKTPLSKDSWLLITMHTPMVAVLVLNRYFLGNFFVRAGAGLVTICFYFLIVYATTSLLFIPLAPVGKRTVPTRALRIGIVTTAIFYLVLVNLGPEAAKYIYYLAVLGGLAAGMYWLPFNRYFLAIRNPKHTKRILAVMAMIGTIVGVLLPGFFGWVITVTGSYAGMFGALALLLGSACVLSGMVGQDMEVDPAPFKISKIFELAGKHRQFRSVLLKFFLIGMTLWGPLDMLVPLIALKTLGSEFKLGLVASIAPLIDISCSYIFSRASAQTHGRAAMLLILIFVAACTLFALLPEQWSIIIVTLTIAACFPTVSLLVNTLGFNIIEELPGLSDYTVEYIVVRECSLAIGRVCGLLGLLCAANYLAEDLVYRGGLVVLALLLLILGWTITRTTTQKTNAI